MKIAVVASDEQWNHLVGLASSEVLFTRLETYNLSQQLVGFDIFINLDEASSNQNYNEVAIPVFINSVTYTLEEKGFKSNIIRLNGWNGFIEKPIWEMAGVVGDVVATFLASIKKQFIIVNDVPGFVSARVLAMIINEAYFAKGDNVSTETDIDIALKLGTNYPYGPFEWSKIIGLKNIYNLLQKLSLSEEKYTPAKALQNMINK